MANRLDRARRRIEELEQQSTGYRDRHDTHESNKQQLALDRANARIAELERQIGGNESRIQSLVVERGQLHAQLKQQQRSANNRPSADKIPMDIFENTADQVSEASLQSAVESLNDSVDTLILGLVDTAEQLVGERHPEFGVPPETQDQKLFAALAAHCESEEKRGFLLEALCHDYIIGYLSALFFAGEAAPRLGRKALILERILVDLTESVPWSVVQRWRSISSESVSRLLVPKARNHLESLAITIADVFTWAYQQPVETFHAAAFKTQLDSLAAIFDDALKLATTVRRDVLSVRMSIVCPEQDDETNYPPYDSRSLNAVWPDMGVVEGDEVIGLFHLGLQRRTEQGRVSLLVKPQVTTAALLREMSKES
ncbi:hypothetical protein C8F01DRAFT_971807 [Mycena amicta]|nr:hypothetical protein C8F01DRAFT_971807 [Mycena amicta]